MSWTRHKPKQSYQCQGAYIKCLRKRRGWSQQQLVKASGYSLRLISKAESGGRITLTTLFDLAQALSTDTEVVRPEMLVFEPIRVARFLMHSTYVLQRDMFQHVSHLVADDFVMKIIGDDRKFPFVGEYRGASGLTVAIDKFYSHMVVPAEVDYRKWYDYYSSDSDDNIVLVLGKSWIHPVGQPFSEPLDISQRIEFKNGKIRSWENRYDAYPSASFQSSQENAECGAMC